MNDVAQRKPKVRQARRLTARPALPDDVEKRAIVAACEGFIRDVLKPRFLAEVRPTE